MSTIATRADVTTRTRWHFLRRSWVSIVLVLHGRRREVTLLFTLVEAAVIGLASWLLHWHRIHVCHINIVYVLLILLLDSNVG